MYVAIKRFVDLTDGDHIYNAFEPSRKRIVELATSKNKLETPLIAYIEDEKQNVVGNDKVEDEKDTPKKTTKKAKSE